MSKKWKSLQERLIEVMYEYPMMYDTNHKDYKNNKDKEHFYDEIGKEFDLTGEEVKKRWKNLRDSYIKFLKNQDSPGAWKSYGSWKWADKMDALYRPFLYKPEKRKHQESYADEEVAEYSDERKEKRTRREKSEALDEMVHLFQAEEAHPERPVQDLDAMDHLMLAYAKTIKSFSPRRQAQTKLKIAQIIMEQELEEIEGQNQ